jgi:hypothetical protein
MGERSTSRPGRFAPGKHWIGGCVGPGADLDAVEKIKQFLAPAGNRTPIFQLSSPYPIAMPSPLTFKCIEIQHYRLCEKWRLSQSLKMRNIFTTDKTRTQSEFHFADYLPTLWRKKSEVFYSKLEARVFSKRVLCNFANPINVIRWS